MKKLILLVFCQAFLFTSYAQSLSYNQLRSVFDSWKATKATNVNAISIKLKAIDSKWKLSSSTPTVEDDTKYYMWTALDAKGDSSVLFCSIEEDSESVKYTLRHVFRSSTQFKSILNTLNSSGYYNGSLSSFTDKREGTFTLTAQAKDTLPMSSRIDCFLTNYNANHPIEITGLYSLDISSRYIPK